MVMGLIVADMLPDKRDAILAHARTMGWHRVQIARHYPADICAGRVPARAIVSRMKINADLMKNLAEAKQEIESARKAANN